MQALMLLLEGDEETEAETEALLEWRWNNEQSNTNCTWY